MILSIFWAELEAKEEKSEREIQELKIARDSYGTIKEYLQQQEQNTSVPETQEQSLSKTKEYYIFVGIGVVLALALLSYVVYRMT